jgi:succinyl-CoA synthetase beta subunit
MLTPPSGDAIMTGPWNINLSYWSQEDKSEVETANYNLNYIALQGDIDYTVNSAGMPWPLRTSVSCTVAAR